MFTEHDLIFIWEVVGESSYPKDKMELGQFVIISHSFWICNIFFVETQKAGFVQYWEERRPFLPVDLYTLIREKTGRDALDWRKVARQLRRGIAFNVEESFRIEG